MWIVFLAAAAGAVVYWYICTAREQKEAAQPPVNGAVEAEIWRAALPSAAEALAEVLDACLPVMEERQLCGTGSLAVQFPQQLYGETAVTVTCRFLDRDGALYARVVRGPLAGEHLLAEGLPQALLGHRPVCASEGGGVVALTAEAYGVPPALLRRMARYQERAETAAALAGELSRRYPALTVYALAGELLLSPRQ